MKRKHREKYAQRKRLKFEEPKTALKPKCPIGCGIGVRVENIRRHLEHCENHKMKKLEIAQYLNEMDYGCRPLGAYKVK